MTKKPKTATPRKRYSDQFKQEALLRAAKEGVPVTHAIRACNQPNCMLGVAAPCNAVNTPKRNEFNRPRRPD